MFLFIKHGIIVHEGFYKLFRRQLVLLYVSVTRSNTNKTKYNSFVKQHQNHVLYVVKLLFNRLLNIKY